MPVINTPQLTYVLIEAKPTGVMANVQMPLNFSLVLDHSGSMAGEKLKNLKEAVKLVLDQLQPQDHVSIIVFDDKADVISPSQPVTNPGHLKSLVDGIKDRGGTEMSGGMKLGLTEVQKALEPSRVSRILLLTDGQTFGDEDRCRQLGADAGQRGIPITALGLGDDWNSELLDAIAEASGGVSDFIEDPHAIQRHFQSTVQSMQATVVNNAQLILRLVGGVNPRQVWRVIPLISQLSPTALSDRDAQVHLGDLEKEQGQAVLVELMLPPRPAGRYRIAQAEVSYDVPAAGVVGEKARSDILLTFTADPALAQQYDPRVMNLVEKVTAFKLQTRALDDARVGNIAGATQKLRAAATRLLDMGEAELAAAAQEEANRLEQEGQMSAAGTKKLQYGTRKLTQKLDQQQ
jgi:Ca-activated chloride channel family protein